MNNRHNQDEYFKDPILQKYINISKTSILIQSDIITHLSAVKDAELMKLIVCILERKKPDERSSLDLQVIMAGLDTFLFFDRLNEFANLPQSNFIQYCKFMELEICDENQYVFEKGSEGNKFYIILNGKVDILIPEEQMTQKNGIQEKLIIMKKVNEINTKGHFGELALLNDAPRVASVHCTQKCHFGILDKITFKNIIASYKINQMEAQTQFFKSIQLFSQLTKSSIHTLMYYFKLEIFQFNQIVYKEYDISDKIYIVKQGEFKLTKQVDVRREGVSENLMMTATVMKQKKIQKSVQFSIISTGEIFGEIDCLAGQKRHFTATALTGGAQAYMISRKDFIKRALDKKSNQEVETFIDTYLKEKNIYTNQRFHRVLSTLKNESAFLYGSYFGRDIQQKSQEKCETQVKKNLSMQIKTEGDVSLRTENMYLDHGISKCSHNRGSSYYSSKHNQYERNLFIEKLDHLGHFGQRISFRKMKVQKQGQLRKVDTKQGQFVFHDKNPKRKFKINNFTKLISQESVGEQYEISPKSTNLIKQLPSKYQGTLNLITEFQSKLKEIHNQVNTNTSPTRRAQTACLQIIKSVRSKTSNFITGQALKQNNFHHF